jgi:N-acetylneuraminic acid mutarotase
VNIDTLTISNTGEEELSWEITGKPDWIELSKSSGAVTTATDLVIITADVHREGALYSDSMIIASNGGNQVVTVTVDKGIWKSKKNMITGRVWLGMALVDGKIYAIGGCTETIPLSNVEVYDPITDSWTAKANMATPRSSFGCAVLDGKIYVIGGGFYDNPTPLASVLMYDPATDTWTSKTSMPTARVMLAASEVNGKIYVIGGTLARDDFLGLSTVEEYDPVADQ